MTIDTIYTWAIQNPHDWVPPHVWVPILVYMALSASSPRTPRRWADEEVTRKEKL